ncbi:MAG: riboflavin kinase [Patescibacteria group bacterium]
MNYELRIKVSGQVIKGEGYGRKLGFPTANLDRRDYSRRKLKIKYGIYAGIVEVINYQLSIINYSAAIVIGPVDKTGLPKIEAYLLKFKGNLYGRKLSLLLVKYLRGFKHFKDVEGLKQQINEDIKIIKKLNY